MSVWITMDMSYVGAGDYDNTSKVSVNVYAHWDTVSWNGEGAPLTVTVDGVSDSSTVTFNTNKTSSGSQNIYSRYWNIGHDSNGSARTVSATASFTATSNSGSLPASDSLDLPAISSGGGSGGDSGDSGDDDTYYQIIVQGVGASVSVTSNSSDGSYPYYKAGTTLKISVSSSSGYNLTSCYIDGVETTYVEKVINSDIYIVVESEVIETTTIQSGLYIDDGSNSSLYECYIDTEFNVAGTQESTDKCVVLGSRGPSSTEYGANTITIDNAGDYGYIKFKTPDNIFGHTLQIKLYDVDYYPYSDDSSIEIGFRIVSNENGDSLNVNESGFISDKLVFPDSNGNTSFSSITEEVTVSIQPGTIYYVKLTYFPIIDQGGEFSVGKDPEITVTGYLGVPGGSRYERYIPYIDNGTSWEPL